MSASKQFLFHFLVLSLIGLVLLQELRWDQDCGRSPYPDAGIPQGKQSRIVNGFDARPGEFPWTAAIHWFGTHICGGVIISSRWVLTGAHCTFDSSPFMLTVVVGQHSRQNPGDPGLEVGVRTIIVHELYNLIGEEDNDISLLLLDQDLPVNLDEIRPACKPSGDYSGSIGTASGWGWTTTSGPTADILQFMNDIILSDSACELCFPPGWIFPGMSCYGQCGPQNPSICEGDTGGPIVVRNFDTGRFDLVGLLSFGASSSCTASNKVFTNVVHFLDWIDVNAVPL